MKSITATELHNAIQNKETYILLDVREKQEVEICKIENSQHIPMTDILYNEHQLNQNDPIVVICHHGMRSAQVTMYLVQNGFTNVSNLAGGINAWATEVDTSMQRY